MMADGATAVATDDGDYVPLLDPATSGSPAAPAPTYVPAGAPTIDPPPGKGLPSDDPFLTRTWRDIKTEFTGEDRIPDRMANTPELTQRTDLPDGAALKLAGQYFISGDPDAVADTAVAALPGATKGREGDYPTVTWNGQTSYVNKPGMSAADLIGGFGDAALALPVGKMIGGIKALGGLGMVNTAVRSGVQALGQGATSIVRDLGAWLLGSKEGVDVNKAVQAAVGGATAEPAAAVVGGVARAAGRAGASTFGRQNLFTSVATGVADDQPLTAAMVNTTGGKILAAAGVQPSDLTVGQFRKMQTMIPAGTTSQLLDGSDQAKTTALNMVRSAQFNIPETVGQLTGNQSQLGREDWLRKTNTPQQANVAMGNLDAQQRAATRQAAEELVPGTPPGGQASTPAEQGQQLQTELLRRQAQQKLDTSAAYDAVAGPNLTKPGMEALPINQQLIFGTGTSQDLLDRVAALRRTQALPDNVVNRIAQLTTPQGQAASAVDYINGNASANQVVPRHFNLGDLVEARRYISGLTPANATEARAISGVTDAIDQAGDAAVARGGVLGDKDMLQRYQTALTTARQGFADFKPDNDAARNFVEKATTPGVSGSEIVDALYGGGRLGFGGQTTQILDHLETMYPPGSQANDVVRSAAARRMLFGTDQNPATLSPTNIANRIDNAVDPASKGFEITQRLFTPDEIKQLQDFSGTMRTLAQSGTRNPSGTAYVIADAIKRGASTIPVIGKAFTDEASAIADARAATAGKLPLKTPRPTDMPLGLFRTAVAPAAGGVTGREGGVAPAVSAVGTGLLHPVQTVRGLLQ